MKNKSSGIYNIIDEVGIRKSINNVLSSDINFNTYSSPKGLRELRIEICRFLDNYWNYKIDYNKILITTGSQQSINLLVNSLLQEGDTVLIEEPTYFGAIDCLKKRRVNLISVELKENGLDLKDLEYKIKNYKPKLIYVTPTFNNPTGYAWDNDYRQKFLKIINKYNLLVIEDDPYSLINFSDYNYKSLYELNNRKNIIYLGTFSKYISPAINVGYILCSDEIMTILYPYKESFDLCTSLFVQYVVLDYLKNNDLKTIIKNKIPIYKKLLAENIAELKDNYAKELSFYTFTKGGLFFSVKFKNEISSSEFLDSNKFYINGTHNNETRINICSDIKKSLMPQRDKSENKHGADDGT